MTDQMAETTAAFKAALAAMGDEERRELAVKLGEAFRKVKEADNERGD